MRRAARPAAVRRASSSSCSASAKIHAAFIGALRLHRHEPLRLDGRLRRAPVRLRLRLRAARRARGPARPRSGRPSAPRSSAPLPISLHPAVRRRRPAAAVRGVRLGAAAARLVPDLRRDRRRRSQPGPRPATGSWSSPTPDEVAALELELHASPERPASIVGQLHAVEAAAGAGGHRPLEELLDGRLPTVARARPRGAGAPRRRGPGRRAARARACGCAR